MKSLLILLPLFLGTLFIAPARADERSAQRTFKGVELYSWKNSNGDWLFALLPGTNRLKTETEVKKKDNWIAGADELDKRLGRLAEGEQVFWFHGGLRGFAHPDQKMMLAIGSSAKKAKVDLHLPPKGEKQGQQPSRRAKRE